tara:strand:- start:101 stop:703 length:603 start_codon:yes stop_codon:yes gene_type:complete
MIEITYDGNHSLHVFTYDVDISYGYIMLDTIKTIEQAVLTTDDFEYDWNNQTGVMSFGNDSTFRYSYNFYSSPNPYIFPFACNEYENDEIFRTWFGFFYDGRIDFDRNGVADELQLASGNPYSFDRNVFNKDLLLNILFASPGEFFSSLLPIESGSENLEHYTIKTLKSEDLENWDTVLTKTVKGTASNLFFKSEISPSE